jgi:hypothetical protein
MECCNTSREKPHYELIIGYDSEKINDGLAEGRRVMNARTGENEAQAVKLEELKSQPKQEECQRK